MRPLWTPTQHQIESTNLWRFINKVNARYKTQFTSYDQLYEWSIRHISDFWSSFWDFSGLITSNKGEIILSDGLSMEDTRFFPEATLNYAENLLKNRTEMQAILFWGEDKVKRSLDFNELKKQVAAVQSALKKWGIKKGDRVAGFMPNMPETIVAMLATTSLGAIWTSCSPDFGLQGILDRFGQTLPKIVFAADGYYYSGKWYSSLEKIRETKKSLTSLSQLVVVPYGDDFREGLKSDEISYKEIIEQKPL